MSYIDGYLLSVPKNKLKAYRKMASVAGRVWMKHGALAYVETASDHLDTACGRSFVKAAAAKPGELVIFSYIVFKSRAHRDKVNAQVMKDPKLNTFTGPMPFDMKRMHYAGFKPIVEL